MVVGEEITFHPVQLVPSRVVQVAAAQELLVMLMQKVEFSPLAAAVVLQEISEHQVTVDLVLLLLDIKSLNSPQLQKHQVVLSVIMMVRRFIPLRAQEHLLHYLPGIIQILLNSLLLLVVVEEEVQMTAEVGVQVELFPVLLL